MTSNEQLIHQFYTCFQNKDFKGMQQCYADNARFSDSVFVNLNSRQVKAMWQMLITNGKDLRLEFNQVHANDQSGKAHWDAYYTFTKTGKKVINRIDAAFKFENGKIIQHTDTFSFHKWARQALGMSGLLLGWTPFLKNKIRTLAMNNLQEFMKQNNL